MKNALILFCVLVVLTGCQSAPNHPILVETTKTSPGISFFEGRGLIFAHLYGAESRNGIHTEPYLVVTVARVNARGFPKVSVWKRKAREINGEPARVPIQDGGREIVHYAVVSITGNNWKRPGKDAKLTIEIEDCVSQ